MIFYQSAFLILTTICLTLSAGVYSSPLNLGIVQNQQIPKCYTRMGPSTYPGVQCPTYTTATSTPCTSTTWSVVITVHTGTTTTTTFVTSTTTTTAATVTNTGTVTATSFTYLTTEAPTTTVTATTTDIVTTSSGTSTIPASSSFIPIQSSLPGAGDDGKNMKKRNLVAEARAVQQMSGSSLRKIAQYPQRVDCYTSVKGKCSVKVVTISIILHARTKITSTATSTLTIISTVVPLATTTTTSTIVSTNIVTSTPTFTATSTTTLTSTIPAATYYAACGSENFADNVNGNAIDFLDFDGTGLQSLNVEAATAYDCCVAGITSPEAVAFIGYERGVFCEIIYLSSGTCPGSQAGVTSGVLTGTLRQISMSNGYCAEITSSQSDSKIFG